MRIDRYFLPPNPLILRDSAYSLKIFFFFNEIECKKGRTSKMQPLWISKDPCITEEKEKLIKGEGGGVGVCASGFEG